MSENIWRTLLRGHQWTSLDRKPGHMEVKLDLHGPGELQQNHNGGWLLYARIKSHKWIPILTQHNPTFTVVPDYESLDRRANIITPCSVTPSHTGNLVSWTLHKHDTECLQGHNLFVFLLSVTCSEMCSEPITRSLSVQPLTNTRHGTNLWRYVWHSVRHNHRMTKINCIVSLCEMGDRRINLGASLHEST